MGWFGKILGGGIGFVVGGPIGAVAGAALGHGLDTLAEQDGDAWESQRPTLTALETAQGAFFVTTFSLLAKIAKADGVVTKQEIDAVDKFIKVDLQCSPSVRRFAIRVFTEAKDSPHSFESLAAQFQRIFHRTPQMRLDMLEILYRVAMADDSLHSEEERMLRAAEQIFQIPAHQAKHLRELFVPDTNRHYAVLGCSPSDSMETIKSRYRALTREHHPDRVISKGLPDEFVAYANRKIQEINAAYEAIQKERRIA